MPQPPTATHQMSSRRAARRSQLLDAAIRAIRRGGGQVAMEDIAAEAGISRPILYRHFGDAGGLYAAVADRFCTDLLARLRRPAGEERPGRELLHRQIVTYLSFIAEEPDVHRFLLGRVPADRPRARTHRSGFSRLVADDTARRLVGTGWDGPRAVVAADLLAGGLEAAASRWAGEPAGSYEELADQLTDLLWAGFRRAGARRPAPA